MTSGQARALEELWPRYGVEYSPAPLPLDALFGRRAPRTLEIGFGNGEHLASLATAHPERDYFGIEVHRPGVGHLMLRCEAERLPLADGSVDFVTTFNAVHHFDLELFTEEVARVLRPGGDLFIYTRTPELNA